MLRSSRRLQRAGPGSPGAAVGNGADWLTLREASEVTGVPTSTIRKWARHENIPSFLEKTDDGYLRVVSMSGIAKWAEEIGRDIAAPEGKPGDEAAAAVAEVDLTSDETHRPQEAPEGSMIVPLDAWNRMLNQLGNLHEAGQQLAEARERAAKAETEATFLKERLAELRTRLEEKSEPAPKVEEMPARRAERSLLRKAYDGWRALRRDRS